MANKDLSNGPHIESYSIDVFPPILWESLLYKMQILGSWLISYRFCTGSRVTCAPVTNTNLELPLTLKFISVGVLELTWSDLQQGSL